MDAPTRVLKTLNHEEPDRVPAFESAFENNTIKAHYGMKVGGTTLLKIVQYLPFRTRIVRSLLQKRELVVKSYLDTFKFFRKVKLDIGITITSLFPKKIIRGGFIDEYGRIMKYEKYKGDGTYILGYRGGYFKDFDDYEQCDWYPLDPQEPIRFLHFSAGKEAQKDLNNEIFAIPSVGALMECTWEGFGLENFSRLLAHRKQAKKVFDDRGKFTLEMVKILAESDAKVVLLWDDYGFKNGLFMSPHNYKTLVFPWLKRICHSAHKQDCKIILHSDGDLLEIFEDLIECGIDALHPIEPTTANPEYDIFKLHKKYGDRLTFIGNISPQMLATGAISEIEEYAKRLIRELAPGGGYIFSSGHSINPAVTLDRWQAVLRIREKYGTYPINIPD
ncbi:MAG: uroporphyrinogen decarboxylase family protein [Candidatus Helarchaeota archaeon]